MNVLPYRREGASKGRRRGLGEIDGECIRIYRKRITRMPRYDAGGSPSSDQEVQQGASSSQEALALSDGQGIDVVSVEGVPGIKIRTGAADPQIAQITDQALSGS